MECNGRRDLCVCEPSTRAQSQSTSLHSAHWGTPDHWCRNALEAENKFKIIDFYRPDQRALLYIEKYNLNSTHIGVGHDVRRAIAQSTLLVESTLHRTCRIAKVWMNFNVVLIRESTISLRYAQLFRLRIVLDIFHVEYATMYRREKMWIKQNVYKKSTQHVSGGMPKLKRYNNWIFVVASRSTHV